MSDSQRKQTVLLIHGTFANQRLDRTPQWYEPGSRFVENLDRLLAEQGSPARCWAHLANVAEPRARIFSWSGRAVGVERDAAARRLRAHVMDLGRDGRNSAMSLPTVTAGMSCFKPSINPRKRTGTALGCHRCPCGLACSGSPVLEIDTLRARDESGQEVRTRLLNLFVVLAMFAAAFWTVDRAFVSMLWAVLRGWWRVLGSGLALMTAVRLCACPL